MSAPLVAVLGTRYPDFAIEEAALAPFSATIVSSPGDSAEEILEVARDAAVVLAGSAPRFTADVLAGLRCRGVIRYGVGTDSVDLEAARRLGIAVARVSDYGTEAVAFHAVATACALLRRLPEADRSVRGGGWGFSELRPLHVPSSLTAGVVGFGRIGRQAAAYFQGLGFAVLAHDEWIDVPAETGVHGVDLDTLLAAADVVSLHAPGSPDGSALLDAPRLAAMRPGSVLVNTARGSLVDLPALVEALAAGRPARAALDVFAPEPVDLGVLEGVEDRLLLTPHMAWYTEESEEDLRRKAAAEAARLLAGEPLRDPVVEPSTRPDEAPGRPA
ncbi:C-terminal binding protein [Nocardioides sp.]|uniref:C-terminal binding protein n=1 Tax=Nocardioides sp. TaxID=35761 RepID=UPI002ED3339D